MLTRTCPRVADALWRDTLVDAAMLREWLIGIGRRRLHAHCPPLRSVRALKGGGLPSRNSIASTCPHIGTRERTSADQDEHSP
jgi:hypothetical protein